jgi:hypothetical protein
VQYIGKAIWVKFDFVDMYIVNDRDGL